MKIYFVSFLARPSAHAESQLAGAYVNCWVRAASPSAAQAKAEEDIGAEDWAVEAVEEPVSIAESTPESAEYLEQAQIDGEVYVFHTWSGPDKEHTH